MPKYLIYSADQMYGGLHGMCNYEVIECINKEAAFDCALAGSYDIIDSYHEIIANLEEQARDMISFDMEDLDEGSPEYDELFYSYFDQYRDEDTEFMVWGIKDTAKDFSIKELNDILFDEGEDYFLEHFCFEL